ncbi:MAG: hypothetical protein KIT84_37890 [Labilithrix sp.]|nr:hypothetical protein [Labilithrix sp.]MCW5816830.1 hypothetical protein [Labilithrix sp.]
MSAGAYREPADLPFSTRQLTWIEATTTEAAVRASLGGRAPTSRRAALDRVTRATFVTAGALLAGGGAAIAAGVTAAVLVPGLLVLAGGVVRHARRPRSVTEDLTFEVVTAVPRFETRTALNQQGESIVFESVSLDGATMTWPAALTPLSRTLAPDEALRVGIARRGAFRSVAWAYPLLP